MSEIKEEPSNVEWTKEMADSCQPSDIVRFGIRAAYNQGYHDAIEAYKTMLELEKEECDAQVSCTECEHYNKEKHYCPRFCSVIRDALEEGKNEAKWIGYDRHVARQYACSSCYTFYNKSSNYCPNCGAKMKEEDDED